MDFKAVIEIKRLEVNGSTTVRGSVRQSGVANHASISDKVFEQRETIAGRRGDYKEEVAPYTSAIQHLKRNQVGVEEIAAVATLEKLSLKVHETSGTIGSDRSNVIQGEAIQQFRQ
uniref:MBF1 domain-containing protein n=1 Tax=Angiostrongylus cantonensis TaxID=6313 RepID=A0A0K0DKP6_ANGCA